MTAPPQDPALVFTVALNGYASAYADCLRSQRSYARRIGARYVAVTRPFRVEQPAHAAWLKIPLLLGALRAGYAWVAFVDSDARVREDAPDFRTAIEGAGRTHMARGRSGRLNSGVIIAENGADSTRFLEELMASTTRPVPEEDRADLKYENGNVIHVARTTGLVSELPLEWNNTHQPQLADHVRHYTGPLRAEHRGSPLGQRVFALRKRLVATPTKQPERRDGAFADELAALTARCQRRYPALVAPAA
ncbi:hypothetical protein [Kineococcus indalonis]|uniref:hypothetical protein n=1 Tax=Kineococcus indalonis TaxID=2696566 RepID=UPI001412363A|nr:hypothetical protein [Kineococcus indalonis]NAZ86843.1 hypothetical protein [Kineococcus indalonis]